MSDTMVICVTVLLCVAMVAYVLDVAAKAWGHRLSDAEMLRFDTKLREVEAILGERINELSKAHVLHVKSLGHVDTKAADVDTRISTLDDIAVELVARADKNTAAIENVAKQVADAIAKIEHKVTALQLGRGIGRAGSAPLPRG